MMKKKGIPAKKAIVITAPLPRSTVTKQKEAVKDVVTAKSKYDSGNKATFTPPLKTQKKKQTKSPGKIQVIGDPKPTADEENSSKTKAKRASPAKTTHSKLSKMKKKETAAKRASPSKTRDRFEGKLLLEMKSAHQF